MTKKEVKELSLKVWRYLAEHPEITRKQDLPGELYGAIRNLMCECPLCELLLTIYSFGCPRCPLSEGEDYYCCTPGQPYYRWGKAAFAKERKEAAEEIVRRIEAWEVGDNDKKEKGGSTEHEQSN
jgi:hypothetical protein